MGKRQNMIDFKELRRDLGEGPMRFAPENERTLEEQLADLTAKERECFDNIKTKWEKNKKNSPFDDYMYVSAVLSPFVHSSEVRGCRLLSTNSPFQMPLIFPFATVISCASHAAALVPRSSMRRQHSVR